jgi:hypothetical protein
VIVEGGCNDVKEIPMPGDPDYLILHLRSLEAKMDSMAAGMAEVRQQLTIVEIRVGGVIAQSRATVPSACSASIAWRGVWRL